MPDILNDGASLTNALLRCTRQDAAAAPAFELVRDNLGLWVLELDFDVSGSWPDQIETVCDLLESHRALLLTLAPGGSDYTLHLAVSPGEGRPVRLPAWLSRLSAECGFEIEICFVEPDPGE